MPSQKTIRAQHDNPDDIRFIYRLAEALVLDGWGATVVGNTLSLTMTTNAPAAIVDQHARALTHHLV